MHLPDLHQLSEPAHHFLYRHDLDELHCADPRACSGRMYLARFEVVLEAVRRCTGASGKGAGHGRVLDLGCAQGNFSLTLAEEGFRVVAVDLQLSFLRYVKLKYDRGELYCVNATSDALPFRGPFDIILLGEVIEHVAHPDALLETLGALLAPSGFLIVTTPNGNRLLTGMPTLSAVTDRSSLTSRQFQPDADGHLYLLTRYELETEARRAGLEVIYHKYFGTPWITGRMKFRIVVRFMPLRLTYLLDQLWLMVPALARLFAEGQIVIAQRTRE